MPAQQDTTFSVSQAVASVSGVVDKMPSLSVLGEISGWRGPNARSGHCYFELKDEDASMSAILWRWTYQGLDEQVKQALKDGLEVQATGSFSVYQKRGSLSFQIKHLEVSGEGILRQQVAALARKLAAEGLLADERKRQIPVFCTRVAVVTSLTGEVIDDVKRTLSRRNPLVEVQVAGCSVQGSDAPATIVSALKLAASARPDAILLVRGGGSYEDLMAFNDESVARAIVASPVPVITGIGHEPDVTIADMVADRRQSTPTAAAESVAPSIDVLERTLNQRAQRLGASMAVLLDQRQRDLDSWQERAGRAMRGDLAQRRLAVEALAQRPCLADPSGLIERQLVQLELSGQRLQDSLPRLLALKRERCEHQAARLRGVAPHLVAGHKAQTERLWAQLDALSPTRVLARGYAIARDELGHVVSDASRLRVGDTVSVLVGAGSFDARVSAIHADTSDDG